MTVGLRIVNDVSYVSTINHDIHFEWQAHYLVRCVGDACSISFTGNICASCLAPVRIILRNSCHQEVYLAARLISFVRVAV